MTCGEGAPNPGVCHTHDRGSGGGGWASLVLGDSLPSALRAQCRLYLVRARGSWTTTAWLGEPPAAKSNRRRYLRPNSDAGGELAIQLGVQSTKRKLVGNSRVERLLLLAESREIPPP